MAIAEIFGEASAQEDDLRRREAAGEDVSRLRGAEEGEDVQGLVQGPAIVLYGNIETGDWERSLTEKLKHCTVYYAGDRPLTTASLETLQLQQQAVAVATNLLNDALNIYVTPPSKAGFASASVAAVKAMSDPERSVVVIPRGDEEDDETRRDLDRYEDLVRSSGAQVVASVEDAVLIAAGYVV